MICQYCNKEFSSKITLYQHQQKAKYCLQLQGSTNANYNCEHCNKSLSTNERLLTHLNACKIKRKKDEVSKENDLTYAYKNSIKDLQNEILNYQEKLREKNEYITKLEAKLEKFENAVVTNMAATSKLYEEDENEEEAIPLGKQIDSIIINDEDRKEVEYSNITLNNVVITSRPIDHYVNATQLCQAGGKKFNDWIRLDTTKELIDELSPEAGIPASGLNSSMSSLVVSKRIQSLNFFPPAWHS